MSWNSGSDNHVWWYGKIEKAFTSVFNQDSEVGTNDGWFEEMLKLGVQDDRVDGLGDKSTILKALLTRNGLINMMYMCVRDMNTQELDDMFSGDKEPTEGDKSLKTWAESLSDHIVSVINTEKVTRRVTRSIKKIKVELKQVVEYIVNNLNQNDEWLNGQLVCRWMLNILNEQRDSEEPQTPMINDHGETDHGNAATFTTTVIRGSTFRIRTPNSNIPYGKQHNLGDTFERMSIGSNNHPVVQDLYTDQALEKQSNSGLDRASLELYKSSVAMAKDRKVKFSGGGYQNWIKYIRELDFVGDLMWTKRPSAVLMSKDRVIPGQEDILLKQLLHLTLSDTLNQTVAKLPTGLDRLVQLSRIHGIVNKDYKKKLIQKLYNMEYKPRAMSILAYCSSYQETANDANTVGAGITSDDFFNTILSSMSALDNYVYIRSTMRTWFYGMSKTDQDQMSFESIIYKMQTTMNVELGMTLDEPSRVNLVPNNKTRTNKREYITRTFEASQGTYDRFLKLYTGRIQKNPSWKPMNTKCLVKGCGQHHLVHMCPKLQRVQADF